MWIAYYDKEVKRFVFHRRATSLYLAKLALAHCPLHGLKAGIPRNGFGVILLKANDLLHFDTISEKPFDSCSATDLSKFIAELQAVSEYSQHIGSEGLIRARKLFVDIPHTLQKHHDFVDIQSSLEEVLGLNYSDIFGLTLEFTSRYFTLKQETVDKEFFQLTFPSTYLNSIGFSGSNIACYLELVSSSSSLKEEALNNNLANDLTYF